MSHGRPGVLEMLPHACAAEIGNKPYSAPRGRLDRSYRDDHRRRTVTEVPGDHFRR
jgi:hypothetical protein